ncbi:MAG: hypothetical protein R2748_20675 [Bryobacterales bacterium]
MATATLPPTSGEPALSRELSSGRRLVITSAEGAETVEIHSKRGQVEVSILLTDEGPVIRASAQRLEVDAAEAVSVDCGRFEVKADVVDLQASGPIRLDGEKIFLNCEQAEERAEQGACDE